MDAAFPLSVEEGRSKVEEVCVYEEEMIRDVGQIDWLQRLAKWRTVFAGWQLGTRDKTDPECQAVRDHRELSLILRAEVNTLAQLMIEKGVFTSGEYDAQLQKEAKILCEHYEKQFPGFKATDIGLQIDSRAEQTTKQWRP